MKRFATLTKLKPGAKAEYIKIHGEIWEDIVKINDACNMHNFTIFCHDDYLFSYFEYTGDNYEADAAKKIASPIIAKWKEFTGQYTEPVFDDIKVIMLEEIWHHDFTSK